MHIGVGPSANGEFLIEAIRSLIRARIFASAQEPMSQLPELRQTTHTSSRLNAGRKSLSNLAYEKIRNEILSGELSIGDVLSRRSLAARLNMSFLPVTEALKRLETEELVESRPRIGTRVRIPSEQDIRDNTVIREALESQAARLCAQYITAEEKERLRASARHLDELNRVSTPEPEDSRFMFSVHIYHMEFHLRIAELARCPGLRRAVEKEQVLVFNLLYDTAAAQLGAQPGEFHSTLAKALCSGDPLVADTAMRAHVRYGLNQVLERLSNDVNNGNNWRLKGLKSKDSVIKEADTAT